MEEKTKCDKCKLNDAGEIGGCPYLSEIENEFEECNCCEQCADECCAGI